MRLGKSRTRTSRSLASVLLFAGVCGAAPLCWSPAPGVFAQSIDSAPAVRLAVRWRADALPQLGIDQRAKGEAVAERLRSDLGAEAVATVRPLLRGPDVRFKAGEPDLGSIFLVDLTASAPAAELASRLGARDDVLYAVEVASHELFALPDDVQPSQVDVFEQIALPAAWDRVRGEHGAVVVAVVDGGFDVDHPDLAANVWTNPDEVPDNGIDDDHNGFVDDVHGWSFSENSPQLEGNALTPGNTRHGTQVAGIVGAVTSNGAGMAGAAWNARVLLVRVANPAVERRIDHGFEGIVYAVQNGADVVNLSWGGVGTPSPFERDVVEWAWRRGAVLVAAAGNGGEQSVTLPAGMPHVLSVASLSASGALSTFSSRGWWVDLAAPGERILGTLPGGGLGPMDGTSAAAPLVSSICALLRTRWPEAAADEISERVRVSAVSVEDQQLPWNEGMLGRGRVNAERALTLRSPSVRLVRVEPFDDDRDTALEPGETVSLVLELRNHLAAVGPLTMTLRSESPHVRVLGSEVRLRGLGTGESVWTRMFGLEVAEDTPIQTTAVLRLELSAVDGSYEDTDGFSLLLAPVFLNHESNPLRATVAVGRIGHAAHGIPLSDDGIGVRYLRSGDLISDGGLMLGVSPDQVSDAARVDTRLSGSSGPDFVTLEGGEPRWLSAGTSGEWRSVARFDDRAASWPLDVEIEQQSIQVVGSRHEDSLLLQYTIRNRSDSVLDGLRVGYACDWSIDRSSPLTNRIDFDAKRSLGLAWDQLGHAEGAHVGVAVLSKPGATSFYGIDDAWQGEGGRWGLYDGFSEAEKWESLSSGVRNPRLGPADVTMVIGTGPFMVQPGDTVTVTFLFAAGDDRADLLQNVEHGRRAWLATQRDASKLLVGGARPNPVASSSVTWSVSAPVDPALVLDARIYDLRGRLVRRVFHGPVWGDPVELSWDRDDENGRSVAAGLYFLRVETGEQVESRRVLLLR